MKNLRAIYKKAFGKSEWIENPDLKQAIIRFKADPTPAMRQELLRVFLRSELWQAVKHLPENIKVSTAPTVITQTTDVQIRTSVNAHGEPVCLVFTDLKELEKRSKSSWQGEPYSGINQAAEQLIKSVLEENFAGIVINPAGDWVELSRAEVEEMARQIS